MKRFQTITLKDLKNKTSLEATNSVEHLISDRTDRKPEIPDHVEQKVELDKIPLIDLDSGDNERDPQVTLRIYRDEGRANRHGGGGI